MNDKTRTRPELADFLRTKRESLTPASAGLPHTSRRRTPGLRREEVAALAGVGLTWYTWLEQGREIGVSTRFLDNLARTLQLNDAERQHLYLLAHQRAPEATGETEHHVPAVITRMLADFPDSYLCYVLNLHWDVLAYNDKADRYFHFSDAAPKMRNFLYLLFTDPRYQTRFTDWDIDAQRLLASFRRDYARTKQDPAIQLLIRTLCERSPVFDRLWNIHEIYQPCNGMREIEFDGKRETYEYASLTFDIDKSNRLLVYTPVSDEE
ncbi:helix-turn-helix transcriptional regulator [Morganella psychrotolerans]|uniref:Transcriptional regulator n=1 Tax=Morganella psychrotolerans TaxID=368603 RepID=A0A1B8H7B8_9GAMM|nr:helix-turn-helix transcriptional regulator [Morganella psychrotolerans]OBU04978.1 transcriptional regulator [Morganella psychrotolerans]